MYWQLIKKELHIQRPAFLMAVGRLLFWALLIAFPQVAPPKLNAFETADVVYFIHLVFVRSWLIALAPMMIGAAVIAEERRLGMWDWHLSLPVSRWTCLLVKILVAAGLALVLVGIIFPLAQMATQKVLYEDSEWIPKIIRMLSGREWNFWFPLILMFCAIYTSSIAGESGKAFYIAIPLFGLIICAIWLPDPFGLMLAPWSVYAAEGEAFVTSHLPLLAAILCAVLGIFAYWNFRYATVMWRKILLQLTLLIISTAVATAITLHLQMSPMGLITQDIEKVKPLVEGRGQPKIDWTGIRPLAARRVLPGFGTNEKRFLNLIQNPNPFDLHPLPKQGVLVVEIDSLDASDQFNGNQYLVLDKQTRHLTPLVQFAGKAFTGSKLNVLDGFGLSPRNRLAISEFQNDGILQKVFVWPIHTSVPEKDWFDQYQSVTIGGVSYAGLAPVVPAGNLFLATEEGRRPPRNVFLYKKDGNYGLVGEFVRGRRFDAEGKWQADKALAMPNQKIVIRSIDGKITHTIFAENGVAFLLREETKAGSNSGLVWRSISVSSSGRYLPYLFTPLRGGVEETYEPVSELRLLDLQSGETFSVGQLQTNVDTFVYEGGFDWYSLRQDQSWDYHNIVSAWSPEKDELAILLDDFLSVCHVFEGGKSILSAPRDLEGFGFDHIDYLNGDTLLAWGQLGLFEIDIERGLGSPGKGPAL